MKYCYFLYPILIWSSAKLLAQPNFAEMPKFTPQSPEAAAMTKYGEYEVSLSTGVPDISITLFEVKSSKFTFPINLTYHASGIKVNEFAGWAGLGWAINEGGRISRTVRGREDEAYPMNVRDPSSINPMNDADFLYLDQLEKCNGGFDIEPDIYNYTFPGKSGRFLFLNQSEIMIPYCGVKVGGSNSRNRLLDESGNIYYYDYVDHPTSDYPNKMISYDPVSSWLLTKMVDAGRTDSIILSYQSVGSGCLGLDYVDYIVVDDQVVNQSAYGAGDYQSGVSIPNNYVIVTTGAESVPSQISYSQGVIKFIPSTTNRQDRPDIGGTGATFKSLDRIEVYSINNLTTPKKTIKFYQSYFINGTNKRLRLDSIRILDNNSVVVQRYKFGYNESFKLPSYDSKQKDLWGYYNGKNNTLLLPKMTIPFINDDGSQTYKTIGTSLTDGRDPDPQRMQAYVLNKITYPTGGYTLFEYETNKYLDITTPKYAGGLRIAKIKSYNEDGICFTKTYKYGENESGYGNFNSFLSNLYYSTPPLIVQCTNCAGNCESCISTKRTRTFTSTPNTDLNPYDGSPVVYTIVTEYFGDEISNTGKIEYTYTYEQDERVVSMGVDNSTRISKFFRRGLLDSKTVYSNINGVQKKVSYTKNYFFKYSTQNPFCSIRAIKVQQYNGEFWPQFKEYVYNWTRTNPVYYGDNLLTSSYEYSYDLNDANKYVLKTTTYDYNSLEYTQVSSITTNESQQNKSITITKTYPTDYTTIPYSEMVAKNIISIPIQEDQYINTTLLSSKKTNYSKYNTFFAPSTMEFKTGTNPWETRIRYYEYDTKGNVLSLSKEGDIRTCYLWGYNSYYPVAKIENATLDQVKTVFGGSIPNLGLGGLSPAQNTSLRSASGMTNAFITTYTYSLLDGLRSETDLNGKTTYYDYDSIGRLQYVKNQDQVILKEYKYHYKE